MECGSLHENVFPFQNIMHVEAINIDRFRKIYQSSLSVTSLLVWSKSLLPEHKTV
jgi:hypothetical protein